MNLDKPTTKELIRDIGSMRETALSLMNQSKTYDSLLSGLLKTDYYYEEEIPSPKMDYLKSFTGWSYDKIRKELAKIYEDLKTGCYDGISFKIHKVQYFFYIKAYDRTLKIELEDIKNLPRIGEKIRVPFFDSFVGEYFFVERIEHDFNERSQEITLWLKPGEYNLFEAYEKDKKYSEGWMSFKEYYGYK